jgi:two-component sensor histidine kinase
MKEYTNSRKAAAIVIHQMFFVMMACSLYGAGYNQKTGAGGLAVLTFLTVVGLVGGFISLAYLTGISGRRSFEDTHIYLSTIDWVYSDVLFVMFVVFIYLVIFCCRRIAMMDFEFSGLLVTVGTVGYLADLIFLIFYFSIVRRAKDNSLLTHSLCYRIVEFVQRAMRSKKNPLLCTRKAKERGEIRDAIEAIAAGAIDTKLREEDFHGQERELAVAVNHIREGLSDALMESTKNERMKADLITNVSHDIKTPLTSIVNYVDLLKRENLENENAKGYIRILDEKSQRLKQLTEDLVEASKISSGNIKLDIQQIDLVELIYQTGGEFNERFEARGLTIVTKLPNRSVMVEADGRQLYRAIENLYTNAAKYALENTRVYVELSADEGEAVFSIRNISKNPLPTGVGGEKDLTARFVRGDESRTTEGSGLGLSIAKNLTTLMGGEFSIRIDGDLFVAEIAFKT